MSRWRAYFDAVEAKPPRATALRALTLAETGRAGAPGFAVDLGSGAGRDTCAFIARGWQVLAIDADAEAIARLLGRVDLAGHARLEARRARMEEALWPPADLVNASFSLPFCTPDRFGELWMRIVQSLSGGGIFAGHLFGPEDDWAAPDLTILERSAIEALLEPLDVHHFEEEKGPGGTAKGARKFWHLYHIVARVP